MRKTGKYAMRVPRIVLVAVAILGMTVVAEADDKWDYPAGRHGVNQVSAGKAGHLRVFDCETTESVETVILWYAKRLGLDDKHSLLAAASKGFDQLEKDTHYQYGWGHDTDDRRDNTFMSVHIRRGGHAHVSFLHRPDYQLPSVVSISIAKTPAGTSVHVIQPTFVSE